jgi:uncharacterized protein
MLYRDFGRTAERVSILGFGCMRLPVVGGRRECIDVPLATEMLHYAIDHGVNYVDTAFPYHGVSFDETPGASEGFVGAALAGGYRERVLLATKLPGWVVNSRADMDRVLDGQLERLRTDHLDCYLLHAMNSGSWSKLVGLGVEDFLDKARADGRIRYAGFSYHDDPPAFAPIVDGYDWDFCQIQYNFMDIDYQAGAAGLAYAAERGLGVVIMEPLKGGRLAGRTPEAIQGLWDSALVRRTPVEWALRFVWNDPRVSLLLSGMSTMEQVIDNVALADGGSPGSLNPAELGLIDQVRDAYKDRTAVDCTSCRYCMPCPSGIDIPLVLSCLNNASLFDDPVGERAQYHINVDLGNTAQASECADCGQCETACPQQLRVPQEMAKAVQMFES